MSDWDLIPPGELPDEEYITHVDEDLLERPRLSVVRDIWTEATLLAAVLFTGLVIGLLVGHALWGDPLDRCLDAGELPRATCESLFEGGR